jgi:hypothetical protein
MRNVHTTREYPSTHRSSNGTIRIPGRIIGRDAERAILDNSLRGLLNGKGQFVIVQGEAGIGKSRLLADLIEKAGLNDCYVCQGFVTAIEKSPLYFAWREVLLHRRHLQCRSRACSGKTRRGNFRRAATFELGAAARRRDQRRIRANRADADNHGAARASSIEQMIVYLLRGPRRIGRPFSFLRTSIGSTTRQRRFCGRLRVVC